VTRSGPQGRIGDLNRAIHIMAAVNADQMTVSENVPARSETRHHTRGDRHLALRTVVHVGPGLWPGQARRAALAI